MQKYSSNITTSSGSAVRGVSVYVFAEGGQVASLFSDRLGQLPLANPVITASDGTYSFYAANGRYSLQCTVEGVKYLTNDVVLLDDPADVAPGAYAYPLATQTEAEDSANVLPRSFTPQRIWQAIAKWWTGITVPVTQGGTGAVNAQGARTALGVDYGTTAGSVAAGNDQRINDGETAFTWGNHANAGYATEAEVAPKLENITGLVLPGTNIAISGSGTSAAPYVIDSGGASGALWGAIGGTLSSQSDLSAALAAKADSAYLGTAAAKDAQVTPLDSTPGRLLQMSAFGLGGPYNTLDNLDCNLIDPSVQLTGVTNGNSLNGPPGLLYYYIFQLRYADTTNRTQIAIPYSDLGSISFPLFMRGSYNDVWSPWKHVWDSDNLDPASFATAAQGAKADSALQSETDPTVPAWAKTPSKPSYTKAEVGLGNVDNTSDANKPVSTAQQAALDLKAALSGGAAANFAVMPWLNGSPIIEFGNNSNGSWIKYSSGVVICYVRLNVWSPPPGVSGPYTPALPIAMNVGSSVTMVSKGDGANNYNYYATATIASSGASLSVLISSSDTAARLQAFNFIVIGSAA